MQILLRFVRRTGKSAARTRLLLLSKLSSILAAVLKVPVDHSGPRSRCVVHSRRLLRLRGSRNTVPAPPAGVVGKKWIFFCMLRTCFRLLLSPLLIIFRRTLTAVNVICILPTTMFRDTFGGHRPDVMLIVRNEDCQTHFLGHAPNISSN